MIVLGITFIVVSNSFLNAKIIDGLLSTHENWAFLGRFCFLSEDGKFEYLVEYDKEFAVQKLLLYFDTYDQWTTAYSPGLTCEKRESLAKVSRKQVINLTDTVGTSGCSITPVYGRRQFLRCQGSRRFNSSRQRWWFIAVSNCNSSKGLSLKYHFWMTNGPSGDFWHEHFSADEFYILPVLIAFCIFYILIILTAIASAVELKQKNMFHSTYKLFIVSVFLQECGIVLQCSAFIKYALDGIGPSHALTLGRLCESASEAVFLLLLLLLAKGFTVTRGRLRLASGVKLTVFMCLYCITYCAIFIFECMFFDPGKVLYLYESPAGYSLIILRGVAWGMFIYAVIFTLQHYPEKSNFYYPFNLLGTLWFVAGPSLILAAAVFVDNWVRESVVCGALHTIALLGHMLFLFMTLPARSNKIFPYHVRTTQVDVMRVSEPDTTLPFSRRSYDPSNNSMVATVNHPNEWSPDLPLELFTVGQTSPQPNSGIYQMYMPVEKVG